MTNENKRVALKQRILVHLAIVFGLRGLTGTCPAMFARDSSGSFVSAVRRRRDCQSIEQLGRLFFFFTFFLSVTQRTLEAHRVHLSQTQS